LQVRRSLPGPTIITISININITITTTKGRRRSSRCLPHPRERRVFLCFSDRDSVHGRFEMHRSSGVKARRQSAAVEPLPKSRSFATDPNRPAARVSLYGQSVLWLLP